MEIHYPLYFRRRKTRTVVVGELAVGSAHPVRIQSMLTSFTYQTKACLAEIAALANAGSELIRLTIPSKRDLANIPEIRRVMREEGIDVPLVADIHFAPHLAVDACEWFEKVRINPGNFSDRPKNSSERSTREFDFEEGKQKLKERFRPLAANLKKYNRALRIGVNQGSLSARMIQTYGDSPTGMVMSAVEAVELMESLDFHNIIVSLKSSNPFVAQKAYRLFADLNEDDQAVPLHVGVTEAGNEDIGRTKSLLGIGALLADGIGDTIRVSLTEPSVNEIAFGKKLLSHLETYRRQTAQSPQPAEGTLRRSVADRRPQNEGLSVGSVTIGKADSVKLLVHQNHRNRFPEADLIYESETPGELRIEDTWLSVTGLSEPVSEKQNALVLLPADTDIYTVRKMYRDAAHQGVPVGYRFPAEVTADDFTPELLMANLAAEGLIDFVLVPPQLALAGIKRVKNILQASRIKLTETDYIACPSCGRTLFDLTDVTANIKQHTKHLKGLKIGIMGCIVNGPGEMADADFGYVGSGTGKIDLYVGHRRVKKNIPENQAVGELIALIKEQNKWFDAPVEPSLG